MATIKLPYEEFQSLKEQLERQRLLIEELKKQDNVVIIDERHSRYGQSPYLHKYPESLNTVASIIDRLNERVQMLSDELNSRKR